MVPGEFKARDKLFIVQRIAVNCKWRASRYQYRILLTFLNENHLFVAVVCQAFLGVPTRSIAHCTPCSTLPPSITDRSTSAWRVLGLNTE